MQECGPTDGEDAEGEVCAHPPVSADILGWGAEQILTHVEPKTAG